MENIKLEADLRLENIFVSINKDNVYKLTDLEKIKEIDLSEKQMINKYIYIVEQTEGTPNIDLLKREFPSLYFDNAEKLSDEELNDYIKLYIANKKNLFISKKLLEQSMIVKTNGVTEKTVNILNEITKSDSVSIEYKEALNDLIEIYNSKKDIEGIKTGVKEIDNSISGLMPGTITVLAGYTGSYKTTWALNIAYNAIVEGKNVLYLSLEVIKEYIFYNLISRHSFNDKFKIHIDNSKLKRRELDDKEFEYFQETIYNDFRKLSGRVFAIDETELENYSFYSLENKFREIEKLAQKETGHGIDMLVVDHAQLLKYDENMKGIGNETNVVNAYVSFFRQQALNFIRENKQVSVLILSQTSRDGWRKASRNEGCYDLTALADSNELERAASLVFTVFCSSSLKQVKEAKVQILKNRDGDTWRKSNRNIC